MIRKVPADLFAGDDFIAGGLPVGSDLDQELPADGPSLSYWSAA
ncbi:hypothetical protein [Nonomuraea recticatena]